MFQKKNLIFLYDIDECDRGPGVRPPRGPGGRRRSSRQHQHAGPGALYVRPDCDGTRHRRRAPRGCRVGRTRPHLRATRPKRSRVAFRGVLRSVAHALLRDGDGLPLFHRGSHFFHFRHLERVNGPPHRRGFVVDTERRGLRRRVLLCDPLCPAARRRRRGARRGGAPRLTQFIIFFGLVRSSAAPSDVHPRPFAVSE